MFGRRESEGKRKKRKSVGKWRIFRQKIGKKHVSFRIKALGNYLVMVMF